MILEQGVVTYFSTSGIVLLLPLCRVVTFQPVLLEAASQEASLEELAHNHLEDLEPPSWLQAGA